MACKICGTVNGVEFRDRSGMFLCGTCHKSTPTKVDQETFDRIYWEGQADTVPYSTRREFYSDYLASKHGSVESYRKATTVDLGY